MENIKIPVWEKYTLTFEEAAIYFHIGENKLRKLAEERPTPKWAFVNGNRTLIKRTVLEKFIEKSEQI